MPPLVSPWNDVSGMSVEIPLPNDKISDTTKIKCTYIHRTAGGDTATTSAILLLRAQDTDHWQMWKLQFYLKTTGDVLSLIMGSVIGQACRFERVRMIRDAGSNKSLFVITVKVSFKRI